MSIKHNIMLPNARFRKHWQRRVKTWFNQPMKHLKRRRRRIHRAKLFYPMPVRSLKPIVQCTSQQYNFRPRLGRGFTFEEIEAAGLSRVRARQLGITVDKRRKNRCEESLNRNVERLKTYLSRLIIAPNKKKDPEGYKKTLVEMRSVRMHRGVIMPIKNRYKKEEPRPLTEEEKNFEAYATHRRLLKEKKQIGKLVKAIKEDQSKQ